MKETMISASSSYFEALNSMNREAFLACFSQDAEIHDPYGGRPFVGSEGLGKWFAGFQGAWKQFSITHEGTYVCGNRAAVKWNAQGEASNGKRATFSGIDIFTIDNGGLIERMDGYWDAPAMLAQIR